MNAKLFSEAMSEVNDKLLVLDDTIDRICR